MNIGINNNNNNNNDDDKNNNELIADTFHPQENIFFFIFLGNPIKRTQDIGKKVSLFI